MGVKPGGGETAKGTSLGTETTALRLTPRAEEEVRALAARFGTGVRLSLAPGGCCGTSYRFALGPAEPGDLVLACGLAVAPDAAAVTAGAVLDYGERLKPSRFRVLRNPNTPVRCPCGRSFGRPFPGKPTPWCQAYRPMAWM